MLGSRVDQLTNFGPGPISAGWATPRARRYRLLLALFPPDLSPFEPWLERVSLPVGTRLVEPNTPIEHVYSLEQSIASVVATTPQGRRIEVGIIGREALSIGAIVSLNLFESPGLSRDERGRGMRARDHIIVGKGCPTVLKADHPQPPR